jgi:ribosomal protein S18 acetylase RimI-like enzyme
MDFTIEELSMNAWPSIQTILYDGWILRMANGYTKRANSINLLYKSKINLEEKIEYCRNLYSQNNLPAIYKLLECDEHKIIDNELETLSYEKLDITSVQICNNLKILDNDFDKIIINDIFTDEWVNGFIECNNIKFEYTETLKVMLKNTIGNKIIIAKKIGDETIGCGYGVIENGYIGIFDIVVKESRRGNGYGKEIVQTILSEAGKIGVKKSYLQVVNNNEIAKNIYKKLGYEEKYKYWYRKKEI